MGPAHACDLRIAGDEGVLMLDFDRVQAQLLLEGDKERAEVAHVRARPAGASSEDSEYTCDGAAQFLVDTCLGRETVNRARSTSACARSRSWKPPGGRRSSGQDVRVADLVT